MQTMAISQSERSLEQSRAFHALHGDRGFSSWERTLTGAKSENRPDIQRNALVELYELADKSVS